jgi:uncharacterized protein
MHLELSEIPEQGLSIERTLDRLETRAHEGEQAVGELLARPATLVAEARPGKRGVDLSGRIDAWVRLECSRCLEPYESRLEVDFSLVLVPRPARVAADEHRLEPAEAALFHTEEGRADLRALVREQLHLGLPLKPICRPECAGLCPTCGANRNHLECACYGES